MVASQISGRPYRRSSFQLGSEVKAKTREMEKVQSEVEDEIRNLKRYEQFFLSGLDGNVVLEQSGNVVFANPVLCGTSILAISSKA